MMMRVDDRQLGLEDLLLAAVEPVLTNAKIIRRMRSGDRLGHYVLPVLRIVRGGSSQRNGG